MARQFGHVVEGALQSHPRASTVLAAWPWYHFYPEKVSLFFFSMITYMVKAPINSPGHGSRQHLKAKHKQYNLAKMKGDTDRIQFSTLRDCLASAHEVLLNTTETIQTVCVREGTREVLSYLL